MIQAFASRQFLAFLFTGGLAAIVNFGARILLNQWMGFSAAIVLAYLIGMTTAFFLARLFVFGAGDQSLQRSAALFAAVNLLAVVQTWAVSMVLALWALPALGVTRFVPEIAHAVGVVVPVFSSYLGHKRWSFRDRAQG